MRCFICYKVIECVLFDGFGDKRNPTFVKKLFIDQLTWKSILVFSAYRLFVTGFMDLMVNEAVGEVREAVDCYILR